MTEYDANQQWFRVMQDTIFSGEAARMGPYGWMVYSVIKAHSNMSTGEAFPGIPLIAKEGGMSPAQVKRELDLLEKNGYLVRTPVVGRSSTYQLRERVNIKDSTGNVAAVGWWDYVPLGMQAALNDLKNVTLMGDLNGAKIIHIEHMTVNVQNGDGTQVNFNANVGQIPEGPLGDSLRQLIKNRKPS